MRRLPRLALVLLAAGCVPQVPGGAGILVQTARGRCANVLISDHEKRVCAPRIGGEEKEQSEDAGGRGCERLEASD